MHKMDWSIFVFSGLGALLLKLITGLPFLVGVSVCLVAWLLHPLVIIIYRLCCRLFGSVHTKLFFALARKAKRDDVASEKFSTLAALYDIDPGRDGIDEVKRYRSMIEDMNSHHARFPDARSMLKSTYLRRCLRAWSRELGIDPLIATRQFDMAMAEAHASEYRPRPSKIRELSAKFMSRTFGTPAKTTD